MSTVKELFIAVNNASYAIQNVTTTFCPPIPPGPQPNITLIGDLVNSTSLAPQLSQNQTNGASVFGTLAAPTLPLFLPYDESNTTTPPWGSDVTTSNTNPEIAPDTGVTRTYDFVISRGTLSPDGVSRSMLLINGSFPGPMIEANWGDIINVTVRNAIESANENGIQFDTEGTSLHWHGLIQNGTQYYDGVPSVQQCPIAPNASFTYSFKADLYGTSWYHSHFSAQYAAGAAGPMIIHGPSSKPYDIDLGPVMLSDWNHDDYYTLVEQDMEPGQRPVVGNNTLINGKMNYDCSQVTNGQSCTPNAGVAKFQFTPGKVHLLRLINSGAESQTRFSVDEHTLTVIANDFVPIVPYDASYVELGVGQRLDVLVTANGSAGDAYWMRSNIPTTITNSNVSCSLNFQPQALAAVYYEGADTNSVPQSKAVVLNQTLDCQINDLDLSEPSFAMTPPGPNDWATTLVLNMTNVHNETCSTLFEMNGSPFQGDYNDPILPLAAAGNSSYPSTWNVYDFGTSNNVLLYINNTSPIAHPMHLHGHNFWVLAQGLGDWDGTYNMVRNRSNPQRRDVQLTPAANWTTVGNVTTLQQAGYTILGYKANNPGVWPFHCHIAWHVSAGLYVNLVEQPQLIDQSPLDSILPQTCDPWQDFTNNNFVNQIDSGLRIKLA